MCLSVPGKIIEIREDGECIVDYETEKRTGKILTPDISLGDYVILSNKIVVMKVPEEQAKDYLNAIKNVETLKK